MDVTELLFRLYEGVGAALATRPQKMQNRKTKGAEIGKHKNPKHLVFWSRIRSRKTSDSY